MLAIQDRAHYEPGSGVSWGRLPIMIALATFAGVGMGWCFQFAFFHGWYVVVLLSCLGGLALGGVMYLLVGWARCRNRWLAAGVGGVAGVIAYLAYFQFCFIQHLPIFPWWRFDLLPRYIALRMETDVAREVGRPDVPGRPKKPASFMNWFTFGFELLWLGGIAAALAWRRSRHAYCVELDQWMKREVALVPPESGHEFLDALETGKLPEFVAANPPVSDAQSAARLIAEYASPADGSVLEFPIYISVEAVPGSQPWYRRVAVVAAHNRPWRSTILRQIELEPIEVLALRPLFSRLTQLLELKHADLRGLPADVAAPQAPVAAAGDIAEITPVPEPYRRRVRDKNYALKVNLIGATTLVYFLAGAGLAAAGAWLLIIPGSVPLGIAALMLGIPLFAWGTYVALYSLGVPENRWINRRLRAEIGNREDALVDPQDPGSVYVSIIPRDSFVKIKWTMASDVLLMHLDRRGRQVLMEGDSDRYRIPAAAITACRPQKFFHPMDAQHKNELWMVRLMIETEQGPQELLIGVAHTSFSPLTNARRRRYAEDMCKRIDALRDAATRMSE